MMTGLDAHTLKNEPKSNLWPGQIRQFVAKSVLFHLYLLNFTDLQWKRIYAIQSLR